MATNPEERRWLGNGVAFPLAFDQNTGDLKAASHEESVRQSIELILGTAKGERAMRPDFGCGIHDLVFEVKSSGTAGKISQAVQEALLKYEPRIEVLDVQVAFQFEGGGEQLLIQLSYRIQATNNVFNLVYPFYLEQGVG
jgi:uncharacterized protein